MPVNTTQESASTVTTKPATTYPYSYTSYYKSPVRADFTQRADLEAPHIKELLQMHLYRRPAGSATEKKFINVYLRSLKGAKMDAYGNIIVRVGKKPTVLWSSHTDTVHRTEGRQRIEIGDGILTLHSEEKESSCLGADCTVGVWMMRQMILRKIPGLYIFHREEECGGGGSRYIATKTPELLAGINHAIAFDRMNVGSIITHQGTRCASNKFALALAEALNTPGNYKPDDGGTFTDTANYTDLVRECTNISVGYYSQHTRAEAQDVDFADHLLNRICALDTTTLPVEREVTDNESAWGDYDFSQYYGAKYDRQNSGRFLGGASTVTATTTTTVGRYSRTPAKYAMEELIELCERYPSLVARFLDHEGYTGHDIELFDTFYPYEEDERGVLDLTEEAENEREEEEEDPKEMDRELRRMLRNIKGSGGDDEDNTEN